MKVQNAKESNTDFKPIEVTITIESKEEFEAIDEMLVFNVSIPKLVNDKYSDYVIEFLNNLRAEINK